MAPSQSSQQQQQQQQRDRSVTHLVRDLEREDRGDTLAIRREHRVQSLGLDEGAREAVKDEARGAVRLL